MLTTRFETLLDVGIIALALQPNHHGARTILARCMFIYVALLKSVDGRETWTVNHCQDYQVTVLIVYSIVRITY